VGEATVSGGRVDGGTWGKSVLIDLKSEPAWKVPQPWKKIADHHRFLGQSWSPHALLSKTSATVLHFPANRSQHRVGAKVVFGYYSRYYIPPLMFFTKHHLPLGGGAIFFGPFWRTFIQLFHTSCLLAMQTLAKSAHDTIEGNCMIALCCSLSVLFAIVCIT
jgi:hypothetical protein